MSITEDTDLHPMALRHHYIEINGEKWEIDTVQLAKDPEPDDIVKTFLVLIDHLLDIPWKYETMIFKIENEERVTTIEGGATSFGYYRSDESEDIVKAHDQIVQLIAEGRLRPVKDEEPSNLQISPAIVKAMTRFDTDETEFETCEFCRWHEADKFRCLAGPNCTFEPRRKPGDDISEV